MFFGAVAFAEDSFSSLGIVVQVESVTVNTMASATAVGTPTVTGTCNVDLSSLSLSSTATLGAVNVSITATGIAPNLSSAPAIGDISVITGTGVTASVPSLSSTVNIETNIPVTGNSSVSPS